MKRKIFIMGASTGIGKALAINYASDNTILGLGARRVELLEELKKNVNYEIVKHLFMKMM